MKADFPKGKSVNKVSPGYATRQATINALDHYFLGLFVRETRQRKFENLEQVSWSSLVCDDDLPRAGGA